MAGANINEAAAPTAIEPPPALDEAAPKDGPVTVTELAVADLQSFREAEDEDIETIAAEGADSPEPLFSLPEMTDTSSVLPVKQIQRAS